MPRQLGNFVKITKNDYFSHFAVKDKDGNVGDAHRMTKQVRNVEFGGKTYSIQMQGILPDGGMNVFAKKHLVATGGGKFAGTTGALGKSFSVLDKRMNSGVEHGARGAKLAKMTDTVVPKSEYAFPAELDKYRTKRNLASTELKKGYEVQTLGGTKPPGLNTLVMLDNMTPDAAWGAFAAAIAACGAAFDTKSDQTLTITFPGKNVVTVHENRDYEVYDSLSVDVVRGGNIYHVYHANKAVNADGSPTTTDHFAMAAAGI